jgi:hypothetical protein
LGEVNLISFKLYQTLDMSSQIPELPYKFFEELFEVFNSDKHSVVLLLLFYLLFYEIIAQMESSLVVFEHLLGV